MKQVLIILITILFIGCEPKEVIVTQPDNTQEKLDSLIDLINNPPSILDTATIPTPPPPPVDPEPVVKNYLIDYRVSYEGQICEFFWHDASGKENFEHYGRDIVIPHASNTSGSYIRSFQAKSGDQLKIIARNFGLTGHIEAGIYANNQELAYKKVINGSGEVFLTHKLE